MLQRLTVGALAAAVSAVVLAGCGGATPAPPTVCNPPAILIPNVIVYPANGATSVPDGNFTLLLSESFNHVELAVGSTVAVPNLLPSATPPPAGDYGYTVAALQAATTYAIMVPLAAPGCGGTNDTAPERLTAIGTFTTK